MWVSGLSRCCFKVDIIFLSLLCLIHVAFGVTFGFINLSIFLFVKSHSPSHVIQVYDQEHLSYSSSFLTHLNMTTSVIRMRIAGPESCLRRELSSVQYYHFSL